MQLLTLYKQFIDELLQAVDSDWDSLEVRFEHYPWKGNNFEKYVAKYFSNSKSHQFDLSLESIDVLTELNKQMGEDGKEKWTWCLFKLDNAGKYNFEFNYGMPPMVENMLRSSGELDY